MSLFIRAVECIRTHDDMAVVGGGGTHHLVIQMTVRSERRFASAHVRIESCEYGLCGVDRVVNDSRFYPPTHFTLSTLASPRSPRCHPTPFLSVDIIRTTVIHVLIGGFTCLVRILSTVPDEMSCTCVLLCVRLYRSSYLLSIFIRAPIEPLCCPSVPICSPSLYLFDLFPSISFGSAFQFALPIVLLF